jgi:hypothetical protein
VSATARGASDRTGSGDDGVDRREGVLVLEEVAEVAVLVLANRRLERDRLAADARMRRTLSGGQLHALADLLGRRLAAELLHEERDTRSSLFIVSTMCTGTRIVRAWSAIARVIAWRIHHVAYVENL